MIGLVWHGIPESSGHNFPDKQHGLRRQPLIASLANKSIIVQMRICGIDPLDFGELTTAEGLVRIQAPGSFQQTLSAQDFVQARDASREIVGSVEEGCIAIRDLQSGPQEIA
jgi:hypothetical protein